MSHFNLTSHLKDDEIPRKYLSFDDAIPRKLSAIPSPKQGDTSAVGRQEGDPLIDVPDTDCWGKLLKCIRSKEY